MFVYQSIKFEKETKQPLEAQLPAKLNDSLKTVNDTLNSPAAAKLTPAQLDSIVASLIKSANIGVNLKLRFEKIGAERAGDEGFFGAGKR